MTSRQHFESKQQTMNQKTTTSIKEYSILFWDFDGVIKDSVEVKGIAFAKLFGNEDATLQNEILDHHQRNLGVSRLTKIPLYLSWSNIDGNRETIEYYCKKFSSAVTSEVIASPWVPGVVEYLKKNKHEQSNAIVTATPHSEIVFILKALKIYELFTQVYGTPTSKTEAISSFLNQSDTHHSEAAMLGDSETDMQAARENNITFFLRGHHSNQQLQKSYSGHVFNDFLDFNNNNFN